MRFESPQTSWRRVARVDTTLAGVALPAGTNIFLSLAAANHQPGFFENPERFDIHRENARGNISFGRGIDMPFGWMRSNTRHMLQVLHTHKTSHQESVPDMSLVAQ